MLSSNAYMLCHNCHRMLYMGKLGKKVQADPFDLMKFLLRHRDTPRVRHRLTIVEEDNMSSEEKDYRTDWTPSAEYWAERDKYLAEVHAVVAR